MGPATPLGVTGSRNLSIALVTTPPFRGCSQLEGHLALLYVLSPRVAVGTQDGVRGTPDGAGGARAGAHRSRPRAGRRVDGSRGVYLHIADVAQFRCATYG